MKKVHFSKILINLLKSKLFSLVLKKLIFSEMKYKILFLNFCLLNSLFSQQNPTFGPEIPVNFISVNFDAMEPHLSPDGNALFFNSLNDGITTSLFYGGKINDSTFSLIGQVPIVNQTITPRLDGVASVDTANNFYWVSTRNYPVDFDNLHRIRFLQSGYTNYGRVHGDFYIYSPGWLIMDAAITNFGDQLYYCNAFFNNCGGAPCKAALGIANKINDSTFMKDSNSSSILAAINDTTNYIVYAPQLSEDGLELYFTRLLHNSINTEICVSSRLSTSAAFGAPSILVSSAIGELPEAATVSADKSKIYYHKKQGGVFKLFLRYRNIPTSIQANDEMNGFKIYPNPATNNIQIELAKNEPYQVFITDLLGKKIIELATEKKASSINLEGLQQGVYLLQIQTENEIFTQKFIKN